MLVFYTWRFCFRLAFFGSFAVEEVIDPSRVLGMAASYHTNEAMSQ
jgi:hypothetical protein